MKPAATILVKDESKNEAQWRRFLRRLDLRNLTMSLRLPTAANRVKPRPALQAAESCICRQVGASKCWSVKRERSEPFIGMNFWTHEWQSCDGGRVVDCASGSKTSCLEITCALNPHVLQQSRWNQALANLLRQFLIEPSLFLTLRNLPGIRV